MEQDENQRSILIHPASPVCGWFNHITTSLFRKQQ